MVIKWDCPFADAKMKIEKQQGLHEFIKGFI